MDEDEDDEGEALGSAGRPRPAHRVLLAFFLFFARLGNNCNLVSPHRFVVKHSDLKVRVERTCIRA